MNCVFLANLIVFLASLCGFFYGAVTILSKKKALYLKMIALAVACILISRLFLILQHITHFEVAGHFNVSVLGMIGCFLFLLSANYGSMDSLVDDGSKKFSKYRRISWIIPVILAAVFVQIFFVGATLSTVLSSAAIMFFIFLSSKFHFKHIIFPDVDYGVVKCIRSYNLTALVLCFAVTFMMVSDAAGADIMYLIFSIVIAVCCVIILPILHRGVKKWTI